MRKNRLSIHLILAAASLILAIVLGTVSMIAVYCLPTNRMNDNVGRSQDIMQLEQSRFTWAPKYDGTGLDGYTDAIMLGNAVFRGTGNPVQDAMRNPRIRYEAAGNSPVDSLIRYVNRSEMEPGTQVEYARYWHGYLVLLKPLLLFFTVSDLRMMNLFFQFTLMLAVLLELFRQGGYQLAIPFGAVILCLNPISTALCMQYSSIYNLMLAGSWLLLHFRLWEQKYGWLLFLWLGIGTAFFDFLTYPVAALGICLALAAALSEGSWRQKLTAAILSSMAWCFGYGGMWVGKWLVASLVTGENVLAAAVDQVAYRSGAEITADGEAASAGLWEVMGKDLEVYANAAGLLLLLLLVLAVLWAVVIRGFRFRFSGAVCVPLLFISLYPFVWYAVIRNHSMVHCWMTHRNLSATIIALAGFLSFSLKKPSSVPKNKLSGGPDHG